MDWKCPECTLFNQACVNVCQMCGCTKRESPVLLSEWICDLCTFINRGHRTTCEMCEKPRIMEGASHFHQEPDSSSPLQHELLADSVLGQERRLVIIGKTGSGKSTTCNNILEKEIFKSDACGESVTRECQRATCDRFGRNIEIIDTPGLFDTGMSNEETIRELTKCVGMTAPGPHAFVFILPIGRFTKEEQDTVEHFKHIFGEDMMRYLLILFTKKDDLIHTGKSIEQYLQSVPPSLKDLLESCGNRYIAFNNRGTTLERNKDVRDLMNQIDSIYLNNGGKCYTSEMYKEAEKAMLKREEQLRKEHEAKVNRQKLMIQQEFEKKMQQMEKTQAEHIAQLMEQVRIKEEDKEKEHELEKQKLELERERMKMEKELEMERRRMEVEAYKRKMALEANEPNYRNQARQEVNKGQEMTLSVLTFLGPLLLQALAPLAKDWLKDLMSGKTSTSEDKGAETNTKNPADDDKQLAKSPKDIGKDKEKSVSNDDDEDQPIRT